MAQQKGIWLGTMMLWVRSLVLFNGLRIWRYCELWWRSQMWLGSGVAGAVAVAGSCSSNSTPSLGTPYALGVALKRQKTKKKKIKKNKHSCSFFTTKNYVYRLQSLPQLHKGGLATWQETEPSFQSFFLKFPISPFPVVIMEKPLEITSY